MRTLFSLLLAALLLALAGCNGSDSADEAKYQIAVVPKSVSLNFWSQVREGAEAAASELDSVAVIWKGTSDESDIDGQVQIVESFINRGVDAIVIAAADSRGLVPVLKKAQQRNIPVITIDSNTDPQISASFIATNNEKAAGKAADLIAEATDGTGKVALIPYIPGASTSNQRERGFKQALENHPDLELVTTRYSKSDYNRAMTVTEDILTSYPDLDAIFAANEPSVLGAAQALKSRGKAGEITLVGFDASPREIQGVREGTIHGLIVQSPYRMGYEGVQKAYQVIQGDSIEKQVDSGSMVVTEQNLDDFLQKREQRGGEASPSDTTLTPPDTAAAAAAK